MNIKVAFENMKDFLEENFSDIEFDYERNSSTCLAKAIISVESLGDNVFIGTGFGSNGHFVFDVAFGDFDISEGVLDLLNKLNSKSTNFKYFVEDCGFHLRHVSWCFNENKCSDHLSYYIGAFLEEKEWDEFQELLKYRTSKNK